MWLIFFSSLAGVTVKSISSFISRQESGRSTISRKSLNYFPTSSTGKRSWTFHTSQSRLSERLKGQQSVIQKPKESHYNSEKKLWLFEAMCDCQRVSTEVLIFAYSTLAKCVTQYGSMTELMSNPRTSNTSQTSLLPLYFPLIQSNSSCASCALFLTELNRNIFLLRATLPTRLHTNPGKADGILT